jgi:hypothetical protein
MGWPFGAMRGSAALPKEPSQRTALNAILAAGLVIAAVTIGAHACSGGWTVQPRMERYIKLGPRAGPAELERDLLRAYPPGSSIGPLFSHLSRQGFDCGAALEAGRGGDCRFRARREDGRVAVLHVTVAHDGLHLRGIGARMSIGSP